MLVCVSVCSCLCVCVCHSGVWTVTFLCLDNHRALCPPVPPAMTQGNVTCQSQTPTYNRCPPPTPPPLSSLSSPLTHMEHHHRSTTLSPRPQQLLPWTSPGRQSPHYLLPTPFVFLSSTSYDSISSCSFPAVYPNGNPTPSYPAYLPRGLQNMEWEDITYSEWESQGWEVDFLPGPLCACFQLLSRHRRGGGLCVIWECN